MDAECEILAECKEAKVAGLISSALNNFHVDDVGLNVCLLHYWKKEVTP